MTQIAPGRYRSQFTTADSGTYHLELSQQSSAGTAFRQTRGLTIGYSDELRLRPTNEPLLRQLSSASSGRYDPPPATIFDPGNRTVPRAEPLGPYLLASALLLFVVDVSLRRIDFSLLINRRQNAPRRHGGCTEGTQKG
jgi:hypothetical protein